MKFKRMIEVETEVTHLVADISVSYWDDAIVNGEVEYDESPTIPLRDGDRWRLKIDLATGEIDGWPEGVTAQTHYKVCDDGVYSLIGSDGAEVVKMDGYVPDMLAPQDEGYGDYVILDIGPDGVIAGWNADLSYFNRDNDLHSGDRPHAGRHPERQESETMTKEYRISTIADVAALTEDQQTRFLVDFAAWLKFVREFEENAPEQLRRSITAMRDSMIWVDDHDQGEISGFNLNVRIQKGADQ